LAWGVSWSGGRARWRGLRRSVGGGRAVVLRQLAEAPAAIRRKTVAALVCTLKVRDCPCHC